MKRDGDSCFICGKPLLDDITVEHLIGLSHGGRNFYWNRVLAHHDCNQAVNRMDLVEKIKYILKNRKADNWFEKIIKRLKGKS